MEHLKKNVIVTVIALVSFLVGFGQDTTAIKSGTFDEVMRSHDKIYVVMTVCLVILIVLLLYVLRIDVKISRKEKQK